MHSKILMCSLLLALSVTISVDTQLVFEETDTNDKHKPQQHMRQPVTSSKCLEGELLYPGDNNGDWVCDCRPAYLYYPQNIRCYEAYTQGPCSQNEILVLPKGKVVPICARNRCELGKVIFNNNCAKIGSYEGCKQSPKGAKNHILHVNATTLQLNCAFSTNVRGPELINEEAGYYEEAVCFVGGKRSQESICA